MGCSLTHADDIMTLPDSISQEEEIITDITPLDSCVIDVDDKDVWKKKIFRHGWSINDTTIVYPKVLNFGVRSYRWLNHALNYYDTAYVVNPGKTSGKKWKIMLKNNNWIDFYSGHLSKWKYYVQMNSDVTSLFGFQI